MIIAENITTATFIRRPNRFLGYVNLNGEEHACFIPDPGRLKELLYEGKKVLIFPVNKQDRKTKYDLVAIEHENRIVSIDSRVPNKHVLNLLQNGIILNTKFDLIKPEYSYGRSRLDFYLQKGKQKYLVEVKGCNLVEGELALFPDAPTIRGARHVSELIEAINKGYISLIIFVIQRDDATSFRPNTNLDKDFSYKLKEAKEKGVIIKALLNKISLKNKKLFIDYVKEVKLDF